MKSVCDEVSGLLSLEVARQRLLSAMTPVAKPQKVRASEACGRILASDLHTPLDFPPFSNSAMDGYAVKASEAIPGAILSQVGVILAGTAPVAELQSGQCMRIFTGAPMPQGANAVVVQERVTVEGDQIRLDIESPVQTGWNVRNQGEELRRGEVLLKAGVLIGPYELGVMAFAGITEIEVRERLRVGVLATGDELLPPEADLSPGKIHESNRPVLLALIREMGFEAVDLGTVADSFEDLTRALGDSQKGLHAVITTGGASEGDADFVARAIQHHGTVSFWKVAVKPGKPFIFGSLGRVPVFGLPGNPVSSAIIFLKLVKPSLEALSGRGAQRPLSLKLPLMCPLRRQPGRLEFLRGRLVETTAGLGVMALPEQGSHRLTSLHEGDCLIVLAPETREVSPGDAVTVELFRPVSFSEAIP